MTPEETLRDCAIKGNISSKREKIYHVPGGAYFNRTKINKAKGELYFCSEEEAKEKLAYLKRREAESKKIAKTKESPAKKKAAAKKKAEPKKSPAKKK